MSQYTERLEKPKSTAVANHISQNKGKPSLNLADNRPRSVAQLKLQQKPEAQHNSEALTNTGYGGVIQRRLNYSKYASWLSIFSSYTPKETELNKLEDTVVRNYNWVNSYQNNPAYFDQIKTLNKRLNTVRTKSITEAEYEDIEAELYEINAECLELKQTILDSKKKLNEELADKFDVVDKKPENAKSNTLTKEEFKEIKSILEKIYVQGNSALSVQLESGEHFNLAARAGQLELPIPENIKVTENKINTIRTENTVKEEQIAAEMEVAQKNDIPKFKVLKKQFDELTGNMDSMLEPLKTKYLQYVSQYVRDETMKDLVKIAQTGIGRDLLKAMTDEKYRDNMKVVIAVRDFYGAPTGGASSGGGAKVSYTPQALKDRDTLNRGDGKAINRLAALKGANAWQENDRTDITLFHELVHTHHVQNGTLLGKDDLVETDDAVHGADKPFAGSGVSEGKQVGVPKEEYQTVGLGKYAGAGLNENTYRKQRRDLGEEVAHRTQYTHIDEHGRRVGDESAM